MLKVRGSGDGPLSQQIEYQRLSNNGGIPSLRQSKDYSSAVLDDSGGANLSAFLGDHSLLIDKSV